MKATNKEKQCLFLANYFIQQFVDDSERPHKDVEKIRNKLLKLSYNFKDEFLVQIENAMKQLGKISGGEDITCNELALGLNMCFAYVELASADKRLIDSILKDSLKVYGKLWKEVHTTDGFKAAERLVSDFTRQQIRVSNVK